MTEALRPWTIDFHVAQNDATVKGSGSHDKTGRHCLPDDPNGKLDVARHAGFWMRDDDGEPTRAFQHICWDGCMFPNATMMQPQTWNDVLRDDDRGARRARVELTWRRSRSTSGSIGYGFMGRTHSNAFLQAPRFFDRAVPAGAESGLSRAMRIACEAFADNWGYESAETDWRAVVDAKDIDLIDIASPNDTHAEIAIAAARAGKMVMCEKPLGRTAAEAQAMVDGGRGGRRRQHGLVQLPPRAGGRCCSSSSSTKASSGASSTTARSSSRTGRSRSDLPQGGEGLWRLDVGVAGSGVTGDLLAHCIDTALWLNGPIAEVTAMTETFIKERKHNLTGKVEPVGIDDASAFLARFAERIAGALRGDALRARPQGALHARDQRRARVGALGPARSAPPAVVRSSRRRTRRAAGAASTSPTAIIPT